MTKLLNSISNAVMVLGLGTIAVWIFLTIISPCLYNAFFLVLAIGGVAFAIYARRGFK